MVHMLFEGEYNSRVVSIWGNTVFHGWSEKSDNKLKVLKLKWKNRWTSLQAKTLPQTHFFLYANPKQMEDVPVMSSSPFSLPPSLLHLSLPIPPPLSLHFFLDLPLSGPLPLPLHFTLATGIYPSVVWAMARRGSQGVRPGTAAMAGPSRRPAKDQGHNYTCTCALSKTLPTFKPKTTLAYNLILSKGNCSI